MIDSQGKLRPASFAYPSVAQRCILIRSAHLPVSLAWCREKTLALGTGPGASDSCASLCEPGKYSGSCQREVAAKGLPPRQPVFFCCCCFPPLLLMCRLSEISCLLGCMHAGLDACAAGKQAEEGAAGSHSGLGRQQHIVAQQGECCLDFASGHGAQRHCQDAIRRSSQSVWRNRVFHRRTRILWATVWT